MPGRIRPSVTRLGAVPSPCVPPRLRGGALQRARRESTQRSTQGPAAEATPSAEQAPANATHFRSQPHSKYRPRGRSMKGEHIEVPLSQRRQDAHKHTCARACPSPYPRAPTSTNRGVKCSHSESSDFLSTVVSDPARRPMRRLNCNYQEPCIDQQN